MVIDEFQNYLPEQIRILKHCLNEETQSVVYVGDMAQQVKLGTIRDWKDIKEAILPERNITLNKVYRNTKNILCFIKDLAYDISLPDGLKEGPSVVEKIMWTTEEEIGHIKKAILKYREGSIGILARDESYLADFKREFSHIKNVHVRTMLESQGVEFDLVCIVGIGREPVAAGDTANLPPAYLEERKRIEKDLLYVALTRAITELHVLGRETLWNKQ
jgi:superfamily I DNA/RNA helicase